MKKVTALILALLCVFIFASCGAQKVPSLDGVYAQLKDGSTEPEEILPGLKIKDVRKAWGEPDSVFTEPDADIWYLSGDGTDYLALYYDDGGKVDWVYYDFASTVRGTVTQIDGASMLFAPEEGSWELSSSDIFSVGTGNMDPSPEPQVGDVVEITYGDGILETYPATFGRVYSITVIR